MTNIKLDVPYILSNEQNAIAAAIILWIARFAIMQRIYLFNSFACCTSSNMGPNRSNLGDTRLSDDIQKKKRDREESNPQWKQYGENFSTNTYSMPEKGGYKKFK